MSYSNNRILIVDTEDSVQSIRSILIEELGFIAENIYSTDGIMGAFDILESTSIDLILSEWKFSDVSGLDFLIKVREHDKYGNLPFIMTFSEIDQQVIKEALAEKASHYIVKPFSAHKLNSKLRQVLIAERRVHDRCKVIKENKITVILENKQVSVGKIVNIGKGGLLAQLDISQQLVIYDQPMIHISFSGNQNKEVTTTFNTELLRIERASKDKAKKTAYYAFAFIKLDKSAKKFLARLVN